jgi:hypothetical protein
MKRNNILSNILGLPWDTDPTKANTIRKQVYRADSIEEYDAIIDSNREYLRNPEATLIWLKIKDAKDPWEAVEKLCQRRRGTISLVGIAVLYTNSLICTYFVTLLHL